MTKKYSCDLLGFQMEKVTKTYQIITENDINTTLDEIQKSIESNHEKISVDSKKKFLTYRKMDVNIFKYEALKKHVGTYIELPEKLQKRSLINIKNKDGYCFIWSYIRHINPQEKNPNRIKLEDKKLFTGIYEKLKDFKFPLEINKTNIKKIEDILKINIYILASDENDNIIPIFSSENAYEENLFYYKNHIFYIKDLNSYLYSNDKSKKRKCFCNRCLNSFLTQENLDKHKYLCMKYNKRLEKIILPEEGSKLNHLADVFQKFSNFAYETYGLDLRYSYTIPGFSWQAMLKMTKIELDLISDQDMYLLLMDSIRGGICQVNKKHSKADNKYTRNQHNEWSDKKIKKKFKSKLKTNNLNKYLLYLDANYLYGYSMSQKLPYKNFKWSNDLTLDKIQTGIYEVDISIPENLHNKFKDYPLAPEIKSIPENNLSEYQKYLNNKLNIKYNEKDKKLILDLLPKKIIKYIIKI